MSEVVALDTRIRRHTQYEPYREQLQTLIDEGLGRKLIGQRMGMEPSQVQNILQALDMKTQHQS